MKQNSLIERYIYAVSKYIPARQRKDVCEELESVIQDMLQERCGDVLPSDRDIRVVLAELGTPEELGSTYSSETNNALISGIYFVQYKYLLKLIIMITTAVLIGVTCFEIGISKQDPMIGIYDLLGQLVSICLSITGALTIVFYCLERKSVNVHFENLDGLPNVPKKEEKISIIESIVGIAICVLMSCIFILFPSVLEFSFISEESNYYILLFDAQYVYSIWPIILLMSVIGIVQESIKIIQARYTRLVMFSTIISNVLSLFLFYVIYRNGTIFDVSFIQYLESINASFVITYVIPAGLFVVLAIDTVLTIVYTMKAEKNQT